jgi:TRAP-type C4-dicarboxylate transport system substrate-binding protein
MKKNAVLVLEIFVLLSMLFGCGQSSGSTSPAKGSTPEKVTTIRISTNIIPGSVDGKYYTAMAQAINEAVKDVHVETYLSEELGNSADGVEAALRGANIAVVCDPSFLEDVVPDFAAMSGPYLYGNYDDVLKVVKSDWYKEIEAALAEKGIHVFLNHVSTGYRHIMSRNKKIVNTSDMRGVKIRIPQNTLWMETLTAMGGSPMGLNLSEVYSSLDSGVIDAVELPLQSLWSNSLYEVCKYLSLTYHFNAVKGIYMSEAVWQQIPPESRKLINEIAWEYGINLSKEIFAEQDKYLSMFREKGVEVVETDFEGFRNACAVVYTKFPQWTPGLYDRLMSIIKG